MKSLLALLVLVSACAAEWAPVPVPTKASFRGLSAVSNDVIWASGTQGTVIRTTDGGQTWAVMQVPGAERLDFRGIRAFDQNTALIMSSGKAEEGQARIYCTRNAGKTWDLVFQDKTPGVFMDALAFWDRDHGIVLSDPVDGHFVLFITHDGGSTWKRIAAEKIPAALPNEGAFAASNSCLVVRGSSNAWFATGGASVARVFRSLDRGKTWLVAETPLRPANASTGIFSLAFRNADAGVAVGGDYANPTNSPAPNILVTSDGGKTWRDGGGSDPKNLFFSAVIFVPGTYALWVVGSHGMNSKSNDSWRNEGAENYNAIAFPRKSRGWVVGPDGRVAKWTAKSERASGRRMVLWRDPKTMARRPRPKESRN